MRAPQHERAADLHAQHPRRELVAKSTVPQDRFHPRFLGAVLDRVHCGMRVSEQVGRVSEYVSG